MKTAGDKQFEVLFDGDCPLCKREIAMIRRKDRRGQLIFTDITAPDFESSDRTLEQLMREIHGRLPNGTYVTGVQVFREIYSRLGFGFLVSLSKIPGLRQALDLGYWLFAKIRFRHAMHRMKKQGVDCQSCQVKKNTSLGSPT